MSASKAKCDGQIIPRIIKYHRPCSALYRYNGDKLIYIQKLFHYLLRIYCVSKFLQTQRHKIMHTLKFQVRVPPGIVCKILVV